MSKSNRSFGRLLKGAIKSYAAYKGISESAIEDALGEQIGVSGAAIQWYKTGHVPPEARTVEILATAAVRHGYMNRIWLQEFLHAAYYPSPEKLISILCPTETTRPRSPRTYDNLPAPTYSQFVMRPQPYTEVLDGLQQRSSVVLIASLGGMGKTSLVREVAARCLQFDNDAPHFDAVVWASDKNRPGTTNLSSVLDEVARTLDYPGFTQLAHEEKCREVEQLLRRQKVLLIVDNFETIVDGALLAWLLRLPEPSKAIVTTREYSRAFRNNTYVIDLRGMSEAEARELISQRLRFLKIERLVSDQSQLTPLIAATGGNPKAIEIALGCVKYERRPFQQVVDDLYAARGELFDDLFTRAWGLLDIVARQVLLAMTLFPTSAGSEALSTTADVRGFDFDRAVERLTDLALLDVQQVDLKTAPRYTLHPLVQAFTRAKLTEQPDYEAKARERWVGWFARLAERVGWCWNDLSKLDILDPEQDTLYRVIGWIAEQQRYTETLELARNADHYYFVRGLWTKKLAVDRFRIDAAKALGDLLEECEARALHAQLLSRAGNWANAEEHLGRLEEIASTTFLPIDLFNQVLHTHAFYWMARGDFDVAIQWLERAHERAEQPRANLEVANLYWPAYCYYQKGSLTEAKDLFERALTLAIKYNYERAILFSQRYLAEIDLQQGDFEHAQERLREASAKAYEYKDQRHIALLNRSYAHLYALRDLLPAACSVLTEAIDLFERIGIRDEIGEARQELEELKARMSVTHASEPA